ncbi:smoothelin isoform X4 [Hemiscyllium ocellatum]|uniref:smoothelin isoform X4 n=1 Tax=Hemiscyllium ocellatum TaxID=170820 RepID=UPI002966ED54|nr:smoothelin isoform X4 [Hemiscyllium ocellatum]
MSADRYSALDETALRKLLEVTDDLDERRLIRSTICELRRKELKGMEEALSSKRFRSERANGHHENKENRQRQEDDQKRSLDILSGKLESIHDIDELTAMLRNAGEYAERKLIRAAIRKLREREIEAASMPNKPVGMLVHNRALQNERTISTYPLNITSQKTWSTKDLPTNDKKNVLQTQEGETESLGERQKVQTQAQEFQNQRWRSRSESDEIASETVVLDPLKRVDDGSVKSIWGSRQRAESSCLDCHSFSTDLDLRNESYTDSKKYMTSNGSRGTLETHRIISTQYNDTLQQNNPSSLNNENASIKETEVFRKNRCASINNNENVIAGPLIPEREDMDSIFQSEISSRNVNLGSVQNWLNSDINDNIPSATTGRANDNNEENTCFMTLDNKIIYEDQTPRSIATPSKQKELTELTFGLRATPFRMPGSSSMMMDTEQVMTEAAQSRQHIEAILPNGTEKEKENNTKENKIKPGLEDLSTIEDEEVLDKMLDATTDYEERKIIRAAMRELRKKKRDEREREREMRLQELKQKTDEKKGKSLNTAEMTLSKTQKSTDGKIVTSVSKTEKITQADGGNRTLRTTTMESSILKKTDAGGATVVQTKSSFTSSSTSSKKIGSIFDREDDARSSSVSALERKQAEKRKEVMRSQTLPRTSGTQARKALIEKLEKEGGSPGNPAIAKMKVQRSSSCGVPNANSIKQMLLDWCRAKTRGYEHVTIQNFSSSWSDGMAFCALVHNFFPEAFDYSELNPNNRRHNFEVAFKMAEKHADCPQLLDVEDMVRMKEPDWKCVYTYIQEYYRCLVQKGLVKTKTSS